MRTRAVCCAWSDVGSPGSRATSFHTCQVLRPRRAVWALAFTRPSVLPSAFATASAPGIRIFTRLNGWPVCSPTDASPPPSRATAHGSGPMWLATPSSYRTCTDYSLPVSRRTAKDSVRHLLCSWPSGASCRGARAVDRNHQGAAAASLRAPRRTVRSRAADTGAGRRGTDRNGSTLSRRSSR